MGAVRLSGIAAVRRDVLTLAAALRDLPDATAEAAREIGAQVDAVSARVTAKHTRLGGAASARKVTVSGGSIKLSEIAYFKMHRFDPFRKGMPGTIMRNARKIFARVVLAKLGRGESMGQALAAQVMDADAAKKAAKASKPRKGRR